MKRAVRKLLREWKQSLHIADGAYWKINGITDPNAFFRCLPYIFPHGMTLLIEGLEIERTAKSLYEENPAVYRGKVACDTLSPEPESFHVVFTEKLSNQLCDIVKSQGLSQAFDHFKGYSENQVLFTFHDAFKGPLVVSSSVSATAVQAFADALGLSVESAEFPRHQLDYLRSMDRALNPPWWRRISRIFERGLPPGKS